MIYYFLVTLGTAWGENQGLRWGSDGKQVKRETNEQIKAKEMAPEHLTSS